MSAIAGMGHGHAGLGMSQPGLRHDPEWFRTAVFYEVLVRDPRREIPPKGDPSPIDFLRLQVLTELLGQVGPQGSSPMDFQQLIAAAPNMSKEELKRSVQSINTTLDLGKTALAALEAQLKRPVR